MTDPTIPEMIEYLERDGGRVPCSRYGRNSEECAPWAVAMLLIYNDANGSEGDPFENLDYYMGLVVNNHDDVESLMRDHGHALAGTELAYLIEELEEA